MEDFEFEDKFNPWTDGVSSLEHFRYYCCPQCDIKELSKSDFIKHALDTHPKSKALIDNLDIGCGSATCTQDSRKRPNEEQQPIFAPKIIKVEPSEQGTDQNSTNVTKNIQSSSDNVKNPIPSTSGSATEKCDKIISDSNSGAHNPSAPPTAPATPPSSNRTSETTKQMHKCRHFLATLLKITPKQPPNVLVNVRQLIQDLIDGTVNPKVFTTNLVRELKSAPKPFLIPFLTKNIPYLQQSMINGELSITGVTPPKKVTDLNSHTSSK